MQNSLHEKFMRRCLQLAQKGLGKVSPNPLVGSVIAVDEEIIGEGYHREYGKEHAEINALAAVKDKERLKAATLYVNLEPCNHFGKTPPCSEAIAKSGIQKVVIGTQDPFSKVNGAGVKNLQDAGIEVTVGVLESECLGVNRRFFTQHQQKRPYILLKWAQTSNGFMAGGPNDPKYISGPDALTLVHKWRTEEDAFMVGTNTVKLDNPKLTARHWAGQNPTRITLDRNLSLSPDLHLFNDEAKTLVFNQLKDHRDGKTEWIKADMEFNFASDFCRSLLERNIQSVVIEGGKILLNYFIEQDLWDEARILVSKKNAFQMGLKAPEVKGQLISQQELENDTYFQISR